MIVDNEHVEIAVVVVVEGRQAASLRHVERTDRRTDFRKFSRAVILPKVHPLVETAERPTVGLGDVEIAVVVVINQTQSAALHFENLCAGSSPGSRRETEPAGFRDVGEVQGRGHRVVLVAGGIGRHDGRTSPGLIIILRVVAAAATKRRGDETRQNADGTEC